MGIADPIISTLLAANFFVEYLLLPLCVTLGGGGVLALTTSAVGRKREKQADKQKASVTMETMVREMYDLLVTQGPTPLVPNPPPGLAARVINIDQRVSNIEHTLTTNGFKREGGSDTVLDNLEQIRHNTKPAGGETRPQKDANGDYDHT